jgi:hypothetical protein
MTIAARINCCDLRSQNGSLDLSSWGLRDYADFEPSANCAGHGDAALADVVMMNS